MKKQKNKQWTFSLRKQKIWIKNGINLPKIGKVNFINKQKLTKKSINKFWINFSTNHFSEIKNTINYLLKNFTKIIINKLEATKIRARKCAESGLKNANFRYDIFGNPSRNEFLEQQQKKLFWANAT